MTIDEGYIKYDSDWTEAAAPYPEAAAELELWRRPLFKAGLIGHYDDLGVGFGNLSLRCGKPGQFLISGTQTGHLSKTDETHYALVASYDIEANTVRCIGPVQASSESMTHAAIYELDRGIGAIVHVHSRALWQRLLNQLPTTNAAVAYGTPQMANEFRRLFRETSFAQQGLAVMAGHEEGLISIGATLEAAAQKMLSLADGRQPG
jgi:ribulose-5-phosphate 4-epimerase/fuculose-1-phosphate aldolase